MRLNHNLASLNIYRNHVKNLKSNSLAMNNISSGQKISSAKDNPNAIAQSEKLRLQIRGLQMASRNVQDGASMLQNADGALDSVTSMLQRIRELTVQAGGVNSVEDRKTIQDEINQMIKGIDQTINTNEFNGVKLLASGAKGNEKPSIIKMPSGANVGEEVEIPVYKLTSDMIGNSKNGDKLADINILSSKGISTALQTIDGALETVSTARSKYGAIQNRFESLYNNLSETEAALQNAESSVKDADIAYEMMQISKSNILIEAGNAMMVQSNNFPKEILKILENLRG
ncbi:flagellin [Clostridium thermarum]|uniref:flagellin N-terminal helical domain-containing protein n=1 Tax=Clostridium thermarum TaxID=1716543 RepID=UPI001121DD03|nr:flagellin [Clostridium thermarum]